jgi:hypothetical protein
LESSDPAGLAVLAGQSAQPPSRYCSHDQQGQDSTVDTVAAAEVQMYHMYHDFLVAQVTKAKRRKEAKRRRIEANASPAGSSWY